MPPLDAADASESAIESGWEQTSVGYSVVQNFGMLLKKEDSSGVRNQWCNESLQLLQTSTLRSHYSECMKEYDSNLGTSSLIANCWKKLVIFGQATGSKLIISYETVKVMCKEIQIII